MKKIRKNLDIITLLSTSFSLYLFQITFAISFTHNNQRPEVNIFSTYLSTSSFEDKDVVSDEIIYSYDRTTSYTTNSVIFQRSKLLMGINFSADALKAPPTQLNSPSILVVGVITNPFLLRNIYQNESLVKNCSISIIKIVPW